MNINDNYYKEDSNWVYCVVLSDETPHGWKISYRDIVEKNKLYFHPIGVNGWPKRPVNYIAFRYKGKLLSIHKVEEALVFTNPNEYIQEVPKMSWEPCFLYKLGPGIVPKKTIINGRIFPSGRIWCMIDTFFTAHTIQEAKEISTRRSHY